MQSMRVVSPGRLALAMLLLCSACENPPPSATDAGPGPDAGRGVCVLDRECQDGVFCNGEERCMPGATDADPRGCVPANRPVCGEGYVCEEEERYCRTECGREPDADGDGHTALDCGGDDCDDEDATRYPGNVEICDAEGHDEDCNPSTFGFVDADGDGSGADACCNGTGAERVCGDDCNDADSLINPRAGESCDRIDNNCDGLADETCPCMPGVAEVCGTDEGECVAGRRLCIEGLLGDCIGAIGPTEEICDGVDNDCDGMTDEHVLRTYYADADGDGYGAAGMTLEACSAPAGYASNSADCDDALAIRNPSSAEICNGLDDDCDMTIDEGLLRAFFTDADGDGFGSTATRVMACAAMGRVERGGDCDDGLASVSPVGVESCNARDDDCDGATDEGVLRTFYRDQDGDGYGGLTTMMACTAPAGYVALGGDCADMDALRNPGRFDACNGIDDDCNGSIDPGCACRDGTRVDCGVGPGGGPPTDVGECAIGSQLCIGGAYGSCVGAVGPSAEVCNGRDDDCNGMVDDGVVVSGCQADADGDGYGAGASVPQCRDATRAAAGYCPPGWTTTAGDCNDANPAVRPGAAEVCNGVDDNCTGGIDEGVTVTGCFVDGDGDTYGIGSAATACRDPSRASVGFCASGYTNRGGDCNDASSSVRPMATELCNGVDDNCDGSADNGGGMICALGSSRAGTGSFGSCASVAGIYTCGGTCTSEAFTPSPPAESCNGLDDDCDGAADEPFECRRGASGYACTTACATVGTRSCSASCSFSGQTCVGTEVCNGCDDDGDGTPDEGFTCRQGETRSCTRMCGSTPNTGTQRCLADCSGWSACTLPELCNGCDDDGDGSVDNGFTCARGGISYCTTACGTSGQLVCNSTCTGYTSPTCVAVTESCNFCDDDGDGTFDDDRPLATGYRFVTPQCPALTSVSTITTCPGIGVVGQHSIRLVGGGGSDAGAVWGTAQRLGWGRMRFNAEMAVSKAAAATLPADGWALVLADGGAGTLGAVGGALGVPYTRTGLAIEWRFYTNNPSVDQVDTITVRQLTGSGSGTVLAGPVAVPASRDFGVGDTSLTQNLIVYYTPDDPTTPSSEETLEVEVAGSTLLTLRAHSEGGNLRNELSATSLITPALTAATGGLTFTADARFGADPIIGGLDYSTTWEFYGTCD